MDFEEANSRDSEQEVFRRNIAVFTYILVRLWVGAEREKFGELKIKTYFVSIEPCKLIFMAI